MSNELYVVEVATGTIQFVIERGKTNSDLDAIAWSNTTLKISLQRWRNGWL